VTRWIKNRFHLLEALLATAYFGYPAKKITVIGITGTDGKTTTTTLIYEILKTADRKVALISTVSAYIGKKKIDTGLHVTTPSPWALQKLIKRAVEAGCKFLVLEVTSHGLDQYRVLGTNISIAVITNITHEHLDYHKTHSEYLKAKSKIFKNAKVAVLNKTDSSYKKLKRRLEKSVKTIPYDANSFKGRIKEAINARFPEIYNRLNACAAISVAKEIGVQEKDIVSAIKNFSGVPGRMEYIKNKRGIKIIVDFAHTPNALENVLKSLKINLKAKTKLICVFGCAGERDYLKRPLMGGISARLADVSVFTAEDPRHEGVSDIIDAMVKGALKTKAEEIREEDFSKKSRNNVFIRIPDRREAIKYAINKLARKGDTVIVCGKGHERSMAYGSVEKPWSDQAVIKRILSR
jgi:UDP-N-acetylmuramoyl-L-alanyl-D-glutamate--2,6-diaminopimelate ligase